MTLGRTSDNKIKIKTDGGLRAVSCGCCGCSFSAFSPSPAPNLPKFKYLTVTINRSFNFGHFNPSLPSWNLECAPAGDDYTCGPHRNYQNTGFGSFFEKTTYFLNGSGENCYCDVAKASGQAQHITRNYVGDEGCFWTNNFDCWKPTEYRAYSATVVDAEWTTWADENGKLFLDQKMRNAKWESSFCEGWDWGFDPNWYTHTGPIWVPGELITDHCPNGELGCSSYTGNPNAPGPSLSDDVQYYYPITEGGYQMAIWTQNHPDPRESYNVTWFLHKKLSGEWGETLEMRP